MRAPLLRDLQHADSWLTRVRDNLGQLLIPAALAPHSANGAPIHLLRFDRTARSGQAQTISLVTHGLIFTVLALLVAHPPGANKGAISSHQRDRAGLTIPVKILRGLSRNPSEGSGSGGDENPIPAKLGDLPHLSSSQIVKPSIPQDRQVELPVPPSIFEASAPPVLIRVENIGLPWMTENTNSAGPAKGHTIGSTDGGTMGDGGPGPAGRGGVDGLYTGAITLVSCVYCPLPVYTDEARQVKVQGTVTLRVLVGPDGRAADIRVVRGVGYGLEERAVQTVRGWKFNPGLDANRRPTAAWITVEAVFRLF